MSLKPLNSTQHEIIVDLQAECAKLTTENQKWFKNYQQAVEERNLLAQDVERLKAEAQAR